MLVLVMDYGMLTLIYGASRVRVPEFVHLLCPGLMTCDIRSKNTKRCVQELVRQDVRISIPWGIPFDILCRLRRDRYHRLIRSARPYALRLPHWFNGDAWAGAATMLSCPKTPDVSPLSATPTAIRY